MASIVPDATVRAESLEQTAQAPDEVSFDIGAQPLVDALPIFGQQAGLQVSAHGDVVRGLETRGVSGRMAPEAALQQLLAGTGLTYRMDADWVVVTDGLGQESGDATWLGPITVEGSGGGYGHAGAADQADAIVVDRNDLERRNPSTVKDVFAGEAGVSVGGGIPSSQKVYVNGVEETNLAVSIDGVRQNNRIFHHTGTTLIDPSLLKQARVDPGVAPADAGPGALGGSIAYETVDVDDVLAPDRTIGGFASSSFETNGNTLTASSSAYGRQGNAEALGFVKRAEGDDYEGGDGTTVRGTSAGLLSGLIKGGYDTDSGHRFELSAEHVNDDADRPYRANMRDLNNRNDPIVRPYDMERQNYTASYGMPDAEGVFDPRVVMGYSRSEVEVPVPNGSVGETDSLSAKVENDFNITDVDTITAGVDFYSDSARYDDPSVPDLEESADNVGFYTQARLQPVEPLRLSFGARGDHQVFEGIDGTEMTNSGLSGNASAAYDVTDFLTLRGGYSNVWGGIALAENFLFNENWSYATDIEPVRSENYTLGFDIAHEGFTFGAGVFRSDFDDARDATYSGGPSDTDDFRTQGYNLSAGYSWGPGFVRATYTDSEIKINGEPGSTYSTQYRGTPLGRVIAVEAAHRFRDTGITIGGIIDAALSNEDTVDAGGEELDSYTVVNLFTEYQPDFAEFLTLRLEANNIFDKEYADRATYGQDFPTVDPLLEQGRSFLVHAKVTF